MSRLPLGLFLVGATCVCGCANSSPDYAQSTQPLLEAAGSTRSDVVAVMASRGIEEQLCTATLLLPNLALTARHCLTTDRGALNSGDCATAIIAEPDAQTRVAVVPGADVDLVPEEAQIAVREYLLPNDEGRLCGQDLAMLLLEKPIEGDWVSVTPTAPVADSAFTAVGYGLFDGDWGQQRQRDDARLVCAGAACLDERLAENEFLSNAGACEGDSGGPAFNANGRQFALVSRTTADCSESAYLGLGNYFEWLQSGVEYAAIAGGYELPAWANRAVTTPIDDSEGVPVANDPDIRARGGCAMVYTPARPAVLTVLFLAALMLLRRAFPSRSKASASSCLKRSEEDPHVQNSIPASAPVTQSPGLLIPVRSL